MSKEKDYQAVKDLTVIRAMIDKAKKQPSKEKPTNKPAPIKSNP